MLESVFILIVAIAFILFLLCIEHSSRVYGMISLVLWLIILVQSFWIEVPNDTQYSDYTLSAVSLIFVFANLIYIIALQFDWRRTFFG